MQRYTLTLLCLFHAIVVFGQGQWQLVWQDEFDGNSLDTTKWSFEVDCWGGGNAELQCYTARPQNTFVQNGVLTLKAIQERYTGTQTGCTRADGCTNTKDYTSSRIRTVYDPKGSWLYGRMEMSAKLPDAKHLWPAFWMLPTDYKYGSWAASGEIDIMEYRGQVKNKVEGTLHFGGVWPNNVYQGSGPITFPNDLSTAFHVYAVEWEKNEVRWYVDQTMYHKMTLERSFYSGKGANPYTANGQPFEQRFHILLNLAIGGGFFPAGTYGTLSAQDAQQWVNPSYQIDYIRVYQRNGTGSLAPATSQNIPASDTPLSAPLPELTSPELAESTALPDLPTSDSDLPPVQQPVTSQPLIGAEDGALQMSSQKGGNGVTMTRTLEIAIGVAGGIMLLLLIAVVILIILRVKTLRKRSESQTDLLPIQKILERSYTEPKSLPFSVSIEKGASIQPSVIGSQCKALYSGDGEYYNAVVEDVKGDQYLVNYGPEFGSHREWATSILL
jgi:beta-glucanase (GH16 family)